MWKEPFNNKSKELIAFHVCGTLPIILSRLKCSHLLATVGFWTNKMETSVTVSNGLMERLESFIGRLSSESYPLKVGKKRWLALKSLLFNDSIFLSVRWTNRIWTRTRRSRSLWMRSGASSTSIRSRFRCCIKENGIYKTNCSSHGYKYTGINVWNRYHLTEKIQAKQDDHYYQNRSSWKLVSSQLFVSRISRWKSRNWKSPHLLIIMGIWSNNLFFFKQTLFDT